MAKLDKSKSYGEVFGLAAHRYEQDGRRFDAQGDEVIDKNAKTPRVQSTAPVKGSADKPTDAQVDAQLKG